MIVQFNRYQLSLCFGLIALIGCGPIRGTYLDIDHGEVFIPCPSVDIKDPKDHAFVAINSSLADNNWVIEASDKEASILSARICMRIAGVTGDPLKRPISECLVLKFTFQENGTITAHNPPEKRLHKLRGTDAINWIEHLERTYAELRCYSKEELSRRNAADKQR